MRKYLNVFKTNFIKNINKKFTHIETLKTLVDRNTPEYNVQ
jgi:hypothetical protein